MVDPFPLLAKLDAGALVAVQKMLFARVVANAQATLQVDCMCFVESAVADEEHPQPPLVDLQGVTGPATTMD